ncbi:chymotrypsin-like protease CTRL-1 [Sinocyclocheilus grahami]|uniref:chymotrypsin-like protease CTRL-1 n=1 Tax=Sinocyclocheilus grahami TaxID=75366 RepID=UPI0007AD062E|nr:PREDICTED: chymotrypsin-like protease CTRL-1 [Sinocyclocheilus grahami]
MKFNSALSVAAITLLYITGSLCQLDVCGRAPLSNRIFGGGDAKAGDWPWQVSIHVVGFGHNCGGTSYSAGVSNTVMYFGRLKQSGSNPNETSRTASRIINHPGYVGAYYDNDIALVQLSSSVTFSDYIRPVCLAAAGGVFVGGTESWVTGWGRLQQEGSVSDMLQEVTMTVVSNSDCNKSYGGSITSNMICAGQQGKSVCPGDSGGPMLSRNGSLWIQSGIVSYGKIPCDDAKHPNVYTRVSQYQDWIKSYTGSNPPGFVAFNNDIQYSTPTPTKTQTAASNSNSRSVPSLLLFPLSLTVSIIPFTFSLFLTS